MPAYLFLRHRRPVGWLRTAARGSEPRLSISGDDPVAYLTDGKPVQGRAEIEYLWYKLRWRFASEAHRGLFVKDPDHYAPQYDGYCAIGGSNGDAATVDPDAVGIFPPRKLLEM